MKKIELKDIISKYINIDRDLPTNIFKTNDYVFWFFERPLLDYKDLISLLFDINFKNLCTPIFMLFGKLKENSFDAYIFDTFDEKEMYLKIQDSRLEYPIIISNLDCDWIAFESSYEELGVIGLNKKFLNSDKLKKILNENFITCSELKNMEVSGGWYSSPAKILFKNYCLLQSRQED